MRTSKPEQGSPPINAPEREQGVPTNAPETEQGVPTDAPETEQWVPMDAPETEQGGRMDDADLEHKPRTRDQARRNPKQRIQVKSDRPVSTTAIEGVVMSAAGPNWLVAPSSEPSTDLLYTCTVGGTLQAVANRTLVAVGDRVWVEAGTPPDASLRVGTIVGVAERTTILSRKAAGRVRREQVLVANVEQLAIVVAAAQPDYHRRLIDRYLIAADKGDLTPIIIVNKLDLVGGELLRVILEDLHVYSETLNLNVFFVSTVSRQGIPELQQHLKGKSTLLAGQSGVGKTSVINILTQRDLKIGSISRVDNKGRHTTTGAVLLPLPEGGTVVDSPGIREFSIWELDADELPYYFDEFSPYAEHCRFTPCTHTHEPGCAVKQAVEDGLVEEGRYLSYVVLRDEVCAE